MASTLGASAKNVTSAYTFASQPRAVAPTRRKYRDVEDSALATNFNLMNDPRIARGNTYRLASAGSAALAASETQKLQETQRRRQQQQQATLRRKAEGAKSPEPVAGRVHIDVQTELYLEELTSKVDEASVQVQTDPFIDRPATPLYIPPKTGEDKATQIESGDLFDFDLEVKPLLDVLVGKTLEQALLEVMEEEELAALRQQQREFEDLRGAELAEVQRLEEQARRRREEKARRIQQQAQAAALEQQAREKIAARAFAQSYLSELLPSVFSALQDEGFLHDAHEKEVETDFLPWLNHQVDAQTQTLATARGLLDALIGDVVTQRRALFGLLPDVAGRSSAAHPPVFAPVPSSTVVADHHEDIGAASAHAAEGADGAHAADVADGAHAADVAYGAHAADVAGGAHAADAADGAHAADAADGDLESAAADIDTAKEDAVPNSSSEPPDEQTVPLGASDDAVSGDATI